MRTVFLSQEELDADMASFLAEAGVPMDRLVALLILDPKEVPEYELIPAEQYGLPLEGCVLVNRKEMVSDPGLHLSEMLSYYGMGGFYEIKAGGRSYYVGVALEPPEQDAVFPGFFVPGAEAPPETGDDDEQVAPGKDAAASQPAQPAGPSENGMVGRIQTGMQGQYDPYLDQAGYDDEATTDEATTDEATTDEATADEATADEATADEAAAAKPLKDEGVLADDDPEADRVFSDSATEPDEDEDEERDDGQDFEDEVRHALLSYEGLPTETAALEVGRLLFFTLGGDWSVDDLVDYLGGFDTRASATTLALHLTRTWEKQGLIRLGEQGKIEVIGDPRRLGLHRQLQEAGLDMRYTVPVEQYMSGKRAPA